MNKYIKPISVILMSLVLIVGTVLPMNNFYNEVSAKHQQTKHEFKHNEWIIKWDGPYQSEILEQVTILDWEPDLGVMRVKLNKNVNENEWLDEWKDNPNIKYIERNYIFRISKTPNDPLLEKQEYLKQINAEDGWEEVKESDITIAIVDTGIDLSHPDLKGNLVEGINLLDREALPEDDNGHGTNVAGIAAAIGDNGQGISGITWNTKIMPIKALEENGEGDSYPVGLGIRYAADHGAKIVVLALGVANLSPFMREAVDYAESKGVLIVAATGNEGDILNYPSEFPNVLSVGSVDSLDSYAAYSNYGQQLDVVAPGEGIFTTAIGGDYVINSGTSMAVPQVAGLAALVFQKHPDLSPREVADLIKFTSDDIEEPGWDNKTGYGRINIARALNTSLDILIDGYEQNETSQTAHVFPLEDTFYASLNNELDTDWYQLDLPYKGTVILDITLEQELEHGIQLEVLTSEQLIEENIGPDKDIEEEELPSESEEVTEETTNQGTDQYGEAAENTNESSTNEESTNNSGNTDENIDDLNSQAESNNEAIANKDNTEESNSTEGNNDEPNDNEEETVEPLIYQIKKKVNLSIDLPKGKSFIKLKFVTDQTLTEVKTINYTISNHFTIYEDEYEANDKPWVAYFVNDIYETYTGTINKDYDEDWFRIRFPKDGSLIATVEVDTSRLDPVLWMQPVVGSGKEFDNNSSGKEEYGIISVSAGDYYIKISNYNNYAVNGEYKLNLKFTSSDGDSNEPNDTSYNAIKLDLTDRTVSGNISDQTDYDWFKFSIDEPTFVKLNITAADNLEFLLFNSDLETVWTKNETQFIFNDMINEGTYYFRIHSSIADTNYSFNLMNVELDGNFIDIKNHWAKENIVKFYDENIINGYSDYTFKPNNVITRGEVAAIVSRALQLPESVENNMTFTDVKSNSWAYPFIEKVYQAGIIIGYDDQTFRPEDPIKRDELVVILTRAYNLPILREFEEIFIDVGAGNFAYYQVNTFKEFGWAKGYDNKNFKPKNSTTRAEFVTLMDRVRNLELTNDILEKDQELSREEIIMQEDKPIFQ